MDRLKCLEQLVNMFTLIRGLDLECVAYFSVRKMSSSTSRGKAVVRLCSTANRLQCATLLWFANMQTGYHVTKQRNS